MTKKKVTRDTDEEGNRVREKVSFNFNETLGNEKGTEKNLCSKCKRALCKGC